MGWGVVGFMGLTFQVATGLVIRWMPRHGFERFSSTQSAEVPWRLGRPLALPTWAGGTHCDYKVSGPGGIVSKPGICSSAVRQFLKQPHPLGFLEPGLGELPTHTYRRVGLAKLVKIFFQEKLRLFKTVYDCVRLVLGASSSSANSCKNPCYGRTRPEVVAG